MKTKQLLSVALVSSGVWLAGGLVVHAQVALTPQTLPDGTVGVFYSTTISVSSSTASSMTASSTTTTSNTSTTMEMSTTSTSSGLTTSPQTSGPFAWTLSGNLPPGLNFDTATYGSSAILSGTPTDAGDYTFTINASGDGAINTETYTMFINTNNNATSTMSNTSSSLTTSSSSTTTMDSTATIEAELVNAETELVALEAALSATAPTPTTGTASTVPTGPVFERDLTIGSVGADVTALQEYLNQNGYPVASSGPGSSGEETDYFGPLTQAALAKWQAANGVSPAQGYYGPITRGKIGSALTAESSSDTSTTTP